MAAMGWWEKSRIHQALKRLIAGPGIEVDSTTPSAPVVSAKISTDPSNALSFGTDDGLFATGGGGGSVPTGTGFTHITSGVQDAAAKAVDLATADVTGDLPYANLVPATAASRILVRGSAGGAGDWQEGTLGTGLSLSGTVLNAAGVVGSTAQLTFGWDGAGVALVAGQTVRGTAKTSMTITSATVLADLAGNCTVAIWKDTYANYPPTIADSIVSGAPPTLAGVDKSLDSTLTGWTTTVTAGDTFLCTLSTVSGGITQLNVTLSGVRT